MVRPCIAVAGALLLCALPLAALAQNAPPTPLRDPAEQLLREQQEREREQVLGPEAISAPAGQDDRFAPFPKHLDSSDGPAFDIQRIVASGDVLISQREFRRIVSVFEGHELGVAHINALLDRLTHALVARGYITSRATVTGQSIAGGELTISVQAGTIEQIRYNGQPVAAGRHNLPGLRLAMPMRQGDILRLQDIEQTVDQINRLRRNAAQVQILPGEHPGGSIVELANTPGPVRAYSMSADNQGAPSTGLVRVQGGVEQGNALRLMESLSVGLVTSNDTNALFGSLSLPIGYYTLSFMRSWSEYQNVIGDSALVYGSSHNQSVSLNRLLMRNQDSKLALDLSLTRRNSSREINNLALTPQAQAVARVGVNRLSRFRTAQGLGQWTLDMGVVRGLSGLGADRDPAGLPEGAARAQFTRYEASLSGQIPLNASSGLRSRLMTQWSRTPLYSSEQLFAGGVSSVRGFPESAVGGDKGFVLRNEWFVQDIPPTLGGRLQLQPYLFLDGGRVRSLAETEHRQLLSAGAGVRLALGAASGEIIVGQPLQRPDDQVRYGSRLNLQVGYQF